MITSEQCKTLMDECDTVATDLEISLGRATAAMAVCRALITLGVQITHYERVVATEQQLAL
jgi:isocitrate lyase